MDIKDLNNKIEMLESKINSIKKNESDKRIDLLHKIEMLEKIVIKNKSARMTQIETIKLLTENSMLSKRRLNNKIETLESKINNIFDLLKSGNIAFTKDIPDIDQETTETIKLNDKYDLLEAKYFKLLQAIDEIRKDGETITLKELKKFNDWDELNEYIYQGLHKESAKYEAEQMMIDECFWNNKLNEEK